MRPEAGMGAARKKQNGRQASSSAVARRRHDPRVKPKVKVIAPGTEGSGISDGVEQPNSIQFSAAAAGAAAGPRDSTAHAHAFDSDDRTCPDHVVSVAPSNEDTAHRLLSSSLPERVVSDDVTIAPFDISSDVAIASSSAVAVETTSDVTSVTESDAHTTENKQEQEESGKDDDDDDDDDDDVVDELNVLANGDTGIQVNCGENAARLYLSKLNVRDRVQSQCIRFRKSWLTPNEFQKESGREAAKDWKRTIRHAGLCLKQLLTELTFDFSATPPVCRCANCVSQESEAKSAENGQQSALNFEPSSRSKHPLMVGTFESPASSAAAAEISDARQEDKKTSGKRQAKRNVNIPKPDSVSGSREPEVGVGLELDGSDRRTKEEDGSAADAEEMERRASHPDDVTGCGVTKEPEGVVTSAPESVTSQPEMVSSKAEEKQRSGKKRHRERKGRKNKNKNDECEVTGEGQTKVRDGEVRGHDDDDDDDEDGGSGPKRKSLHGQLEKGSHSAGRAVEDGKRDVDDGGHVPSHVTRAALTGSEDPGGDDRTTDAVTDGAGVDNGGVDARVDAGVDSALPPSVRAAVQPATSEPEVTAKPEVYGPLHASRQDEETGLNGKEDGSIPDVESFCGEMKVEKDTNSDEQLREENEKWGKQKQIPPNAEDANESPRIEFHGENKTEASVVGSIAIPYPTNPSKSVPVDDHQRREQSSSDADQKTDDPGRCGAEGGDESLPLETDGKPRTAMCASSAHSSGTADVCSRSQDDDDDGSGISAAEAATSSRSARLVAVIAELKQTKRQRALFASVVKTEVHNRTDVSWSERGEGQQQLDAAGHRVQGQGFCRTSSDHESAHHPSTTSEVPLKVENIAPSSFEAPSLETTASESKPPTSDTKHSSSRTSRRKRSHRPGHHPGVPDAKRSTRTGSPEPSATLPPPDDDMGNFPSATASSSSASNPYGLPPRVPSGFYGLGPSQLTPPAFAPSSYSFYPPYLFMGFPLHPLLPPCHPGDTKAPPFGVASPLAAASAGAGSTPAQKPTPQPTERKRRSHQSGSKTSSQASSPRGQSSSGAFQGSDKPPPSDFLNQLAAFDFLRSQMGLPQSGFGLDCAASPSAASLMFPWVKQDSPSQRDSLRLPGTVSNETKTQTMQGWSENFFQLRKDDSRKGKGKGSSGVKAGHDGSRSRRSEEEEKPRVSSGNRKRKSRPSAAGGTHYDDDGALDLSVK